MTVPVRSCLATVLLAGSLAAGEAIVIKAGLRHDLNGGDDLARLQHLASGVGWEFEPDATTTAGLIRLGIRTIRCINVDPLEGGFAADGSFAFADPATGKFLKRLQAHLDTCRTVGASPHIILGTGLPPELRVPVEPAQGGPGIMGQNGHGRVFGPTDPERYIAYLEAYITYVMVTQGFSGARFEFGNEPEIHGQFPHPAPPLPGMGSRALFEGYLAGYRLAAAAADRVQRKHPELAVRLGGPALAWAYTFRFGDFNWGVRFIEACAAQRLRLDFLGLHFYGNISSLDGQTASDGGFPPFTGMLATVVEARDRLLPRLPICISEWGPSYHGAANPSSAANSDSMGAAWSVAFLDLLLQSPVDSALYLTTTDLRKKRADGGWDNVFGWPALFTNPSATGTAWPKAPFHAFDMIARLRGHRVEATRPAAGAGCFAAADPGQRSVRVLAWNFDARLPESSKPIEQAVRRLLPVEIADAGAFFPGARVATTTWLLTPSRGDAYAAHLRGETLDAVSTALTASANAELTLVDGRVATLLDLPPSSVALIEFTPIPTGP